MKTPCAVLLVEDDAPVRERLAGIIEEWDNGNLIAACPTLANTLEYIQTQSIDLLITDLKLPDGNGIEAIKALRLHQPNAEIMVISALGDYRTVIQAIEAGATGFLLKETQPFNLINAIKELLAGGSPLTPSIARTIIGKISNGPNTAETKNPAGQDRPLLTSREMEILQGVAKGLTNTELASVYGISPKTAPVHIRNIYRKLETRNRSETIFEAMRLGLIQV